MADAVKGAMDFSAEEYRKGTYKFGDINDNDLFGEVFSAWKVTVQIASDMRNRTVIKITELIEKGAIF